MLAKQKLLIAGALVLLAVPGLRADEASTAPVAPAALPSAVVKCPGISSIPLTADQEQSLPLQTVKTLGCGEMVAVLADTEGYTAHVRTSDGKDGYVARMYLAETAAVPVASVASRGPEASAVNGVARWMAGATGCDAFVSHGRHVEWITANGITVQVSVQDTGWKYRANIAISNESGEKVDVTPGIITLDELQPRMRVLPAADTKSLAHTATTHEVLWTLADAVPSRSVVAQSPAEPWAVATPDYLSPRMTLASARPTAFERTEDVDVNAIALKYSTVEPGQKTAGVMWFARDGGARELSMRVPVGDTVFDFAFALEQKK